MAELHATLTALLTAPSAADGREWFSKPYEEWTHDDHLAEARFRVANATARFDRDPNNVGIAACVAWWERELARLIREGR